MWIILTKKIPTAPSPPKFSIFWSIPGGNPDIIASQKRRYKRGDKWKDALGELDEEPDMFYDGFGKEPNASKTRIIHYMGRDVHVQSGEYNVLKPENMHNYVFGHPADGINSHELVGNDETTRRMLATALETDLRSIYEAALLDGCNEQMARYIAIMDESDQIAGDEFFEFPPVGWYRPILGKGIVECFADPWELEETPPLDVSAQDFERDV